MNAGRCADAIPRFTAAIAARLPSADAHLGRAGCEAAAKNDRRGRAHADRRAASRARQPGRQRQPRPASSPTAAGRRPPFPTCSARCRSIPDLHQARFGLAIAYARTRPPGRGGERGAGAPAAPPCQTRPSGRKSSGSSPPSGDPNRHSEFVNRPIGSGHCANGRFQHVTAAFRPTCRGSALANAVRHCGPNWCRSFKLTGGE